MSVGCTCHAAMFLRLVFMKERSNLPPLECVGSPLLSRVMSVISSRRLARCSPSGFVGLGELSMLWWALKSPPMKRGSIEAWVNSSPASSTPFCCLYKL